MERCEEKFFRNGEQREKGVSFLELFATIYIL